MKKTKKSKKISKKDRFLYSVINIVLGVSLFSIDHIVSIFQNGFFLNSGILAFENKSRDLFLIVAMTCLAIPCCYFMYCESQNIRLKKALWGLWKNNRQKFIVLVITILFILSLLAMFFCSKTVLTLEGEIIQHNLFGIQNKTVIPATNIESVELCFSKQYTRLLNHGRISNVTFSYNINLYNGEYICLDHYEAEQLPIIDTFFEFVQKKISGEKYMEEWIDSLICNESIRAEIRSIFIEWSPEDG